MAETGKRNDPYLAFRFEIRLDNIAVGGFSECSGLQLETEVKEYAEGGTNSFMRKFPTRTKQSNLTLKRGIVDRVLWDWYFRLTQGTIERRTAAVIVHDFSGREEVMKWEFSNVFPCKWSGPELDASQGKVAVETLELCHEGFQRTK